MKKYICKTCGVQYRISDVPPSHCIICTDERQYVRWDGQEWTTLEQMRGAYSNQIIEVETGLFRIGTRPVFAIGQHAFLIQHPDGNILWDCITLLDDKTIAHINRLGGLAAIVVSHPHYYSTLANWSEAFGNIPVYVHAADQDWIVDPFDAIQLWEGKDHHLATGLALLHGGGHFAGSAMLHWADGCENKGILLPGDTIQVVYDRRWVSFMYSFVNYIPLSASAVKNIVSVIEPYQFEKIYSPWKGRVVQSKGKDVVIQSANRYIKALSG